MTRTCPTIVVPTRNRAPMACAAIRSAIEQHPDLRVLVSDNSTDEDAAREVAAFCEQLPGARVRYVRPPAPLAMTAHWQWALQRALEPDDVTHVAYLTDRMVMKRGELQAVLSLAASHPDKVISYNHDAVDDYRTPVGLQLYDWTGRVFEIEAAHLLYLSSRGVIRPPLPRPLNSLVPRAVFEQVASRFGGAFASISPDFCFTYRCLDTVDSIFYYDKAVLLQYAMQRSQGASYSRGEDTKDRVDFAAQLGTTEMNNAAPVPAFHTIRNAIFHEYNFVRAETGSGKFPPIDPRAYMAAVLEDFSQIENRELRSRMFDVLRDNGWVGAPRMRYGLAVAALRPVYRGWDVVRTVARAVIGLARRVLSERVAGALGAAGLRPPPGLVGFRSTERAIEYANRHPRAPSESVDHLEPLFSPPGHTREVPLAAAASPPDRILA
jgi:hypothetical protein